MGAVLVVGAIVLVVLLGSLGIGAHIGRLLRRLGLIFCFLLGAAAYVAVWITTAYAEDPRWMFYTFAGLNVVAGLPMLFLPGRGSLSRPAASAIALVVWGLLAAAGLALSIVALAGDPLDTVSLKSIAWSGLALSSWLLVALAILVWKYRGQVLRLPGWLRDFAAGLLGESANFMAVVAGLGGYYIFGLAGGWLALLMGLWSHIRWLNLAKDTGNRWLDDFAKTYAQPDQMRVDRVKTLGSEVIGIVTILAILTPNGEHSGLVEIGGWVSLGLLALAALVLLACALYRHRRRVSGKLRGWVPASAIGWAWVVLSCILLVLGAVLAGVFAGYSDSNWPEVGRALGIVGALAIILLEAVDSFPFTQTLMGVASERTGYKSYTSQSRLQNYLAWERNLWVILGTLFIIVDLVLTWPLEVVPPNDPCAPCLEEKTVVLSGLNATGYVHTAVFIAGVSMAGLGTLRGIINILTSQPPLALSTPSDSPPPRSIRRSRPATAGAPLPSGDLLSPGDRRGRQADASAPTPSGDLSSSGSRRGRQADANAPTPSGSGSSSDEEQ
jgi:hypothetical protein